MRKEQNTAFILLGSNLGDSTQILQQAIAQISTVCGTIVQASSVYQTAAWGIENQQNYLNQVVEISTHLRAQKLLPSLLQIELFFGRKRTQKWGARTLDLDLLFYNNLILNSQKLTLPHPLLHLRKFTLIPMSEIAPNWQHPVFKQSIAQLLATCPDDLLVKKI